MGMFLVYLSIYKMNQLYKVAVKIINNQVILSRGPGRSKYSINDILWKTENLGY